MHYADIILPLPLDGLFTYALTDEQAAKLKPGMRVQVPLGKSKRYVGIALKLHDVTPSFEVKPILNILDDAPILLPQQRKLWDWISDYYMAPLGDIMKAALPSGLKAEDGWKPRTETYIALSESLRNEQALHQVFDALGRARGQKKALATFLYLSHWDTLNGNQPAEPIAEITREELMNESQQSANILKTLTDRKILYTYQREVGRLNFKGDYHPEKIKQLNDAQQDAYNQILLQMMKKNVVLLHGVTSSGKTEIFIHFIEKMLQEGKQVLYLLPEIALTVQMMERLQAVFGSRLGIYHSKYSDAERVEIWKKQLSDHPYDVILGARSAVFLPFHRLGMVIIDEEHETSFKQQDPAPRYHARSAAIMLAQMYGAKTLLGTATPSIESWHNAQQGKYGYVPLMTRYKGIELPEIRVIDIKDLRRRKMMSGPFSPTLLAAIRETLEQKKQVILFQNRRGFAPMIECRVCGWVPKCENCDVSLTLHKNANLLTCHYCGFTYPVPDVCPNCESTELRGRGYGTEKIEDQLREIFPQARIARMDLDTTRTRNAYERIIGDFSSGRTDVLIGTQMVSKGLDFGGVRVVGILDADSMLNYPDFRAYEHAFMMMAQVSGRAGRKGGRGLVLLQTRNPEMPVIQQVVKNDFRTFYADLLEERRLFHYPPFYHLVYIFLKHRQDSVVESAAIFMGSLLRQALGERVLGPDKPSVARVKTLCIRKMMIKLENGINLKQVRNFLKNTQLQLSSDKRFAAVQFYFDIDPL